MKRRTKSIRVAVSVVVLAIVVLGAIKVAQIRAMIAAGEAYVPPAQAVTTTEVRRVEWQSQLTAVGSVVAVQGVTISSEVPGTVQVIAFESGEMVKKGELLVRLDTSIERGELASAQASARLASLDLERMKKLRAAGAGSEADLDAAAARAAQTAAAVANVQAVIGKKTIRAPFPGRLGIRQIDLGEVLQSGAPIVSLQSSDPVYVEFSLPQQALSQIDAGNEVEVTTDAFSDETWKGKVEVVDAKIDTSTRNFTVRALVDDPSGELRPGMFVDVTVLRPEARELLVIPASAVIFAPYGDSVYITKEEGTDGGEVRQVVEQVFVRLGERRGDLVAVTSGLKPGDTVVSTGAFKLQNGMAVIVRNDLAPEFSAEPTPPNE
ncbi:MAG TPA: efflux RND transporter periplasmic adaptor subunit [Polyangiales bacterium]|nr:efflux RND transporter periplasmic adaptor subunit [Polyangiales bacterium]